MAGITFPGGSGASGAGNNVTGVSAADSTVTVGGTATAPTIRATVGTTAGTLASGDAPATAAANAALLTEFGQLAGGPKQLWKPAPARSSNLFTVANLYQGATLGSNTTALNKTTVTPTASGTGANQKLTSRVTLPAPGTGNVVSRYRLTFTVSTTSFTGSNMQMIVGPRDGSFALLSGFSDTNVIDIGASDPVMTNCRTAYEFDYQPQTGATGPTYLDVILSTSNNTNGSITLNAMTVEQVEWVTPAIWCGWDRALASGAQFLAYQPIGKKGDGVVMRALRIFGQDSTLEVGLASLGVYPENAIQSPTRAPTSSRFSNYGPQSVIHTNNNGQVLTVYKADGTTTELRGNTHGGEVGTTGTFTTDYTVYADYADGNGWTAVTDYPWTHRCWRVKLVANTKITRSDQAGTPFLLVTTTYYMYADGTVRVDRTNTWQQDQKIAHWFYHMTSINPAANSSSRFYGRLGSGRKVLGDVDFTDKLPAPVGGTHTTATTGGTIPASGTAMPNGWSVRVTALSPYGESLPSDVNTFMVTTGTTSTVTANWSASTSPQGIAASGYNVYFGYPGYERFVGTVAAGVTTLTITALPVGSAAAPPTTNTAFTGSFTSGAQADAPFADWSAIYDPNTKAVYSLALDRDTILTHTGVTGIRATVVAAPGITLMKNYWHLDMAGGDAGGMPYTVPSGTVYADTLWFFTYMPADLARFETEQTVRAANVKNLGTLYPAA